MRRKELHDICIENSEISSKLVQTCVTRWLEIVKAKKCTGEKTVSLLDIFKMHSIEGDEELLSK